MLLNELFTRPDPETAMLDAALAAIHRRMSSKGDLQNLEGYAFDIARTFKTGMGPRQLARLYRERYGTNEAWSEKYKRSIDCSNPKGFSQRAHCAGRKKK